MTTAVPGAASRNFGIAGRLGSPGMLRSSTTTRGRWSRVQRSAASTSPASATTRRPSSALSRARRPLRRIAWSSAITMLTESDAASTSRATMARLYRRGPHGTGDLGSRVMDDDATRRRARAGLRSGAERAGARSPFRARGIAPDRLDGPIVGIASTWTQTMPCNLNHRRLAARAAEAVDAAGGVALEVTTIAGSDNQSQGTPGMRASLVSREVIADSIELMVHAHDFDALVCLVGCDKTVPGALMALARVDRPAVVLSGGPMRAGRLDGREVTIQDVWEAVGAHERG